MFQNREPSSDNNMVFHNVNRNSNWLPIEKNEIIHVQRNECSMEYIIVCEKVNRRLVPRGSQSVSLYYISKYTNFAVQINMQPALCCIFSRVLFSY